MEKKYNNKNNKTNDKNISNKQEQQPIINDEINKIDTNKIIEEMNKEVENKKEEILKEVFIKIDEQIETVIVKRVKEEEKKIIHRKNWKIIKRDILILLLIAIVFLLVYCVYDANYYNIKDIIKNRGVIIQTVTNNIEDKNINNTQDTQNKQEGYPSKYYIENFSYLVDKIQITGENELYIYKNSFSKDNLPNNIKLQIAYKNLNDNKKVYQDKIISFSAKDILESAKKVFGENTKINNEMFTYNNIDFLYFNDMYIGYATTLNEISKSNVVYKIYNGYEKDENLIFEVIAANKIDNKIINIKTNEVINEEYKNEDILNYKNKLSKYKFVFSKVNDMYYIDSVVEF